MSFKGWWVALIVMMSPPVLAGLSPISHIFEDTQHYLFPKNDNDKLAILPFLQTVLNFNREEEEYTAVEATEEDGGALYMTVVRLQKVAEKLSADVASADADAATEDIVTEVLRPVNYVFKQAIGIASKSEELAEHLSMAAQAFKSGWSFVGDRLGDAKIKNTLIEEQVIEINSYISQLIGEYEKENLKAINEIYLDSLRDVGESFIKAMKSIMENDSDTVTVEVGDYFDIHTATYQSEKLEKNRVAGKKNNLEISIPMDIEASRLTNFAKYSKYLIPNEQNIVTSSMPEGMVNSLRLVIKPWKKIDSIDEEEIEIIRAIIAKFGNIIAKYPNPPQSRLKIIFDIEDREKIDESFPGYILHKLAPELKLVPEEEEDGIEIRTAKNNYFEVGSQNFHAKEEIFISGSNEKKVVVYIYLRD